MNKLRLIEAGKWLLQKAPAKGLKPENIRYIPKETAKSEAVLDEFVHTTKGSETVTAAKKVTKADMEFFHAYTQFKRIEFPITKAELDELLKLDGDELINTTVDVFMAKMKVPQSLKPIIMQAPLNKEMNMAYNIFQNVLYRNLNAELSSKEEIIGYISHELRHMVQNFDVLRTEGLGEKAVVDYAKKYVKSSVSKIEKLIKNNAIEDYKKLTSDPNAIADFENLVKLRKTNPKEYKRQTNIQRKELEATILQLMKNFRETVISEMGVLKANSEQGIRAKKYLKNFMTNYTKKDGTVDASKYSFLVTEREALNLGWSVEAKAKSADEKFCFMHFLRNYKPKRLDDEARNKEIDKEIQEGIKKISKMDFKEYLQYLYG